MLTPIYGGVDEERGLREQGVGDSTVTFKVTVHSYDEPFITLPEGWESMTESELRDWSVNYLVAEGRIQTPSDASGQGAPKGDWEGYRPDASAVRDRTVCECCGSSSGLTVEDGVEDGVWQCGDCSWDTVDGTELVDAVIPDRQPGDGWFLGSRPGGTAMYSTDEFAASRVTYHEGEPLMGEIAVIEWDAYPSGWDGSVAGTGGTTPYDPARLKDVINAYLTR